MSTILCQTSFLRKRKTLEHAQGLDLGCKLNHSLKLKLSLFRNDDQNNAAVSGVTSSLGGVMRDIISCISERHAFATGCISFD